MESKQILRRSGKQGNVTYYKLYSQLLPIYSVLSVFKSTNSCFKCLDILCVNMMWTHQHTNILSYSFSHSVELPLGFTGVVFIFTSPMWNSHFYTNILDTVRMTWHFSLSVQKQCLHITLNFFLMFQMSFFVVFSSALSKAAYVYDCAYKSKTCLSPFTKGMVNYFLKKASST